MTQDNIIGQKIVSVRLQTAEEAEETWFSDERPATVIVLENGMKIFASRDDEGNGAGTLFTSFNGNEGYLFGGKK